MNEPDYKAFALAIINEEGANWCGDLDGGAIQNLAVKHGILREVKYNPEVHGANDVGVEPGDPWYVFVENK